MNKRYGSKSMAENLKKLTAIDPPGQAYDQPGAGVPGGRGVELGALVGEEESQPVGVKRPDSLAVHLIQDTQEVGRLHSPSIRGIYIS